MGAPIALDDVVLPLLNKEGEITVHDNKDLTSDVKSVLDDVLKTHKDMKEEARTMAVNLEFDEGQIAKDSPQMKNVTDYLASNVDPSSISYNQKPENTNLYNIKVSYAPGIIADNKNDDDTDPNNLTYSDTLKIYNIYFDFDKYEIKPEYRKNLDELAEYMKENPGTEIEIGGHTDFVGSDDYNYILSDRRARAVKDYLVNKGVKNDKVTTKKYGEKDPIANNNSNSERRYNRRVQFTVKTQGTDRYLKVVEENFGHNSVSGNNSKTSGEKVYRIQLFALSMKKDVESFGIPNLKVREANGMYKYYLGDFSSKSEANDILNRIKDKYPNAIVLESR